MELQNRLGMTGDTIEQIVANQDEMNIAHPFLEGNGRSTRIWLDAIPKSALGRVEDWSRIDREDCLLAMEHSPVRDTKFRFLVKDALTDQVKDRATFMRGVDASYRYEGYERYRTGKV